MSLRQVFVFSLGLVGFWFFDFPSVAQSLNDVLVSGVVDYRLSEVGLSPGLGYHHRGFRRLLWKGARRLCDLQADSIGDNAGNVYVDDDPDDGGWDWEISPSDVSHSSSVSPENTYGITAMGVQAAYLARIKQPRFFISMIDAYLGIESRPEVDSAADFVFLCFLGFLTKNDGFFALAQEKYDLKVDAVGSSLALAELIRDDRGKAGFDGLIPFDLGWFAWAARILELVYPGEGYMDDVRIFGEVIASDIHDPNGYFDVQDPHEPFYVLGVACTMHAMQLSGVDPSLVPMLRQKLLNLQLQDGSWYHNTDYPDSDYQTTAYAVQKLSYLWPGDALARKAARAGSGWLAARQLDSGGFEYWPGFENTELNSEILFAIYRAPAWPSAAKMQEGKKRARALLSRQRSAPMLARPYRF